MNKNIFLLIGLSLLILVNVYGQGELCEESEPFCTGSIYTFPIGTTGWGQPGPDYGCLGDLPAPSWYHMLIDNPGDINIYMFSTPSRDIDFICWGPFTGPYSPCVAGLTHNKIVDCSYSPAATENCYIPNGQTGEYYILLITNFARLPCEVTFSQTFGSGSTDCTILPPPVSNNGPLCVGETLYLYADTVTNATYYWSGPNGFLSTLQNPVILNVSLANAGNYQCVITVNGQSSDPAIMNVIIYNLPSASLISGDTTVCAGNPAYAIFQFTGWGPFDITCSNGTETFIAENLFPPQDTIFLYPDGPTNYTFSNIADMHCDRNLLFMNIQADSYPATSCTLSGSTTICDGEPADLVFNLTGTPPWNITYTSNGGSPQSLVANSSPETVVVFPSTNSTYALSSVEDIYCSGETSGVAVISVNPSPTANAGSDQTIAYGTATVLNGSASGGSGNYAYAWQPAEKLVNANVQQPTTINLEETTLFTLTAIDNVGGCYRTDNILVTITGGPLGCFPSANPPAVCNGGSAQLHSMATGGSGNYSYQWSSNPPGFSSSLPDPFVSPMENTTYSVVINDGYNIINGSVTVYMRPLPIPEAGDDITIAHGTNTILDGSASGGSGSFYYHWEPADKLVNPNTPNPQTLNLYSTTLFNLYVSDNEYGCQADAPDQVTVVVAGDALAANPAAAPEEICFGESTQLFALAGGGSGEYSYSWSSTNGFTSTISNPVVSPALAGTYIYTCTVNDGYNSAEGSVAITVMEVPVINFGFAVTTACVYDTLTLNAGNTGSTYIWSNGSSEQTIDVTTTGIGFDMQSYTVVVTNQAGCSSEQSVNVIFDFSACTSVEDIENEQLFRIYPNPGNGNLHLELEQGINKADAVVFNVLGQIVWGPVSFSDPGQFGDILIDFSAHPAGIYFIKLVSEESITGSIKYVLRK